MYKKVITSVFLFTAFFCFNQSLYAQNEAKITAEQTVFDFGKIQEDGGIVSHDFTIKNEGKELLTISQVVASCGCTSLEWSKQPLSSGKTGKIGVSYDPKGRPGDFEKTVSVYSNASKDPYILTIKGKVEPQQPGVEKQPIFTTAETVHDFGVINEADGEALHIFKIKNTGDAPLVISHVQSSCGCAEPEWTREPIQPGQFGDVVIIYNPTNRPGPFKKNITVYTNEKRNRQRLTIKGDVVPKPKELNASFQDTIGVVQMEQKDFVFHTVRPKEVPKKEIWIQNFSDQDVDLSIEGLPSYIKIELPEKLEPKKPQRLKIIFDGASIEQRGRVFSKFVLKTKTASGQITSDFITVAANLIDDFARLSPSERKNSAVLQLSSTVIEFGKLKKTGFLGMGGKPASQQLTITNEGKSPLILHSISTDDQHVEIVALKNNTIQPGETRNIELRIYPKKLKENLDTELHIVCNDARGPVREVKITAEK
ncbi:MAG: DUF1573 domain-containing protein [Tannerella sp.]|jgi:hypothetical protein|nr:DUF1573 domain-containing protein [Tannerella sp.]